MNRNKFARRICYMCDKQATSREHFPPRCFFPKEEDLKGIINPRLLKDYRKNLWWVPSCELHNLEKSKEDEYLLFVLFGHIDSSPETSSIILRRVQRAINKRPHLQSIWMNNPRWVGFKGKLGIAVDIIGSRIFKSLSQIARAAYFYEYKEQCPYNIEVYSPSMPYDPAVKGMYAIRSNRALSHMGLSADKLFENVPQNGIYPEIFYYQIFRDLTRNILIIRMVFYQGFDVLALSFPLDYKTEK